MKSSGGAQDLPPLAIGFEMRIALPTTAVTVVFPALGLGMLCCGAIPLSRFVLRGAASCGDVMDHEVCNSGGPESADTAG